MKYEIIIDYFGRAVSLQSRLDLMYITDEYEIEQVLERIGWFQLDEDTPNALWVELVDGEYGDIFATFDSRYFSTNARIFKVKRTWTEDGFMYLGEALDIVFDLAKRNALDPNEVDPELLEQARRQQTALSVVEDMIVNEFGED